MVVVDEASGVTPEIYVSIESVLSSENARRLEIGNPTDPLSEFAKSFVDSSVHKITITAFDTPNFTMFGITQADIDSGNWEAKIGNQPLPMPKLVTPAWVARMAAKWGTESALYKSRVWAEFPSESPDSLIPLSWIERSVGLSSKVKTPIELGVDVAREGDDHTVIVLREGDYARIVHRSQGHDLMTTVGHCVRLRRQYRATAIKVDVIGVGGGVVDRLHELGEPVIGANVSWASPMPLTYANARSEWLWDLRCRFDSESIVIHQDSVDEFSAELISFRWKPDSKGRISIESKPLMKKRLKGRSPDCADALALAFANVTQKKASRFCFAD
ncbi:MAG: hypothetical protein ACYTEQ_29645 [Planctomycetota bacterium]